MRDPGATGVRTEIASIEGDPPFVRFSGRTVPIEIRRNPRSSRIKLRIERNSTVVLVLPTRVSEKAGMAFVQKELSWIIEKLTELPGPVPFEDGQYVPIAGILHQICHVPEQRGLVWTEDQNLFVTGRSEHVARRITDWLRKTARQEIAPKAQRFASEIDRPMKGVTVRDQKTRWGSCSTTGQLNFSWRLRLMPEYVMDYIVAHEVAHLCHMNHSEEFWFLVDQLNSDVIVAKKWLKENGSQLHRYGIEV